ncbi:hypothetical protein EJB05_46053 [Eragrostis curvula]|uniref:Uncharacterized protein n=1 Tax=Eragrostis curvula TaxID=38414 RepID=A0A5J9TLX9_9POAL|nr:hypothetical protein EJB05_46053 [Eragrostis curvula]
MVSAAASPPHPPPGPQAPPPPPPLNDQQQKALIVNAYRLKAISERIQAHLFGFAVLPAGELAHLVYAFARGIDFALSAGDVPVMAKEIPGLLRKVYDLRKDPFIQSSIMVLIISCKNACFKEWFQPTDSTDIHGMANELSRSFCTSHGQAANDSTVLETILKVMPRYYPQLKFERLITSMEAKVGYDILMTDFFIDRNIPRDEKIRLLVVQKDNLDASSCITNPPHVSFLVNGKGVDKRTNIAMETGPQFPTDITKMLKFGANIIQAVGYFNANYIIAIAFINDSTPVGAPTLDDYAQPVSVSPADSDVLEGPSRVSLNCPISFRRIKTPIKGRLCKHYQILQETGDDVIDVLIYVDGSWKVDMAQADKSERHTGNAIQQTGGNVETDSSSPQVIDLINGNDAGDLPMDWTSASEDTKPLMNDQDLSVADYLPNLPINAPAQAEDLNRLNGTSGGSNTALSSRQNSLLPSTGGFNSSSFGTLESILPQNVLHPVITDAVSPSLETSTPTSGMQHASDIVQLQSQTGPLHVSEARRYPIPRNPRREPIGVQALPVPQQYSGSSRRLQPSTFNCPPPIPLSSPASSTHQAHHVTNLDSVTTRNNGVGSLPRTPSAGPLLHRQSTMQDMWNTSSYLSSRVIGLAAPHYMGPQQSPAVAGHAGGANAYRSGPPPDQFMLQNWMMNQSALAASGQNSAAAQFRPAQADVQSHLFPAQQSQALRPQAGPRASTPQAVPRAPPHLQPPSVPTVALSTHQVGTSDDIPELPVDENWRPTGQMRGSLTGNAYSQAIDRYLGQPAQQQNQTRPPSTSDARRPR